VSANAAAYPWSAISSDYTRPRGYGCGTAIVLLQPPPAKIVFFSLFIVFDFRRLRRWSKRFWLAKIRAPKRTEKPS